MKKLLKTILITVTVFCITLTSVFATESSYSKIVVGVSTDENNITPYTYVTGSPGLDLVNLVYDKLFILDKDNKVIPWMIEDDYKVSDDYKTYEMKLKDNLKWHDGQVLTAEDVKFSFEYAATQNQSTFTKIANEIESVEVKDDLNFVIKLKEGNPDFINDSLAAFFIIPQHIYKDCEKAEEMKETIGSGIFKLEEYKVGEYYQFKANKEYFKGAPIVDELYMPIITDSTAMFNAIKKGEIATSTMNLTPELLDTFKDDDNIGILNSTGYGTTMLQFNTEREILNNAGIRNAIAQAINIDEIIKTVALGYAEKGNPGFYSKTLDYANKDLEIKYSVEDAKKALDEAGFDVIKNNVRENKDGEKLSFELLVYSSSASRIRIAEMIKDYLSEVGIEIKISSLDATTVDELVWPEFDVAKGRDFDMAMWGWSAGTQLSPTKIVGLGDSDTSIGTLNIGGYKSDEFDKKSKELSTTLDENKRLELIKELQAIIAKDLPFVNLMNQDIISVYNKSFGENWVMQNGVGVINRFSFLNAETKVSAASDSNKTTYIGAAVVIIAIAGVAIYFSRKKRA